MSRLKIVRSLPIQFIACSLMAVCVTISLSGCQPPAETSPDSAAADHDHADHDHSDHDHDHADHDHADHDHADHDHADHDHGELNVDELMPIEATPAPENLADGVAQLSKVKDAIAQGFADEKVDEIHSELHQVGNLLEAVEQLVDSSELSAEAKEKAAAAIESLFDAYGEVDAKLHGADGKEYSDVSADIDAAVKTLTELK